MTVVDDWLEPLESADQTHEVIYTIGGLQEGLENREQRIHQRTQER